MPPAGPDDGVRYCAEVWLQAEAECPHARPDEPLHIGVHQILVAARAEERQAGREQELAVEQVRSGVLQLARLHPAKPLRPVAAVVKDRQLRRQLAQELRQRDETEPLGAVSSHGHHRRPGPEAGVHKVS